MSMLDSFFSKGFKASKCKTLLKLVIPRIKLMRNRREIQIKQMRKDITKLLETGQEATARIRVEHIIREENMMAAQEILELFCELIVVRLPIIESQRECPLDLKEAISSVCFAAPRCADLPELLQVQISFASKYGKEFVAAATELMPNCGVNRQLIELLSVRAPPSEKKFKLLREIAEEHELDWDPAPSEGELFKSHEDLLNGPAQFVSGSKVPLPKEKHDENLQSASTQGSDEQIDSEDSFDNLEFPEVPKVPLRPSADPEVPSSKPSDPHPALDHSVEAQDGSEADTIHPDPNIQFPKSESPNPVGSKQFIPFISPPSFSSTSISGMVKCQFPSVSNTKSDINMDLYDVLTAAKAAAESAERATAAARSAASLAEVRISEFTKSKNGESPDIERENPYRAGSHDLSAATEKLQLDDINVFGGRVGSNNTPNGSKLPSFGAPELDSKSSTPSEDVFIKELPGHQPERIRSMDDDSDFTYPNLFSSQSGNLASFSHSPDGTPPNYQP